MIPRGIRNNNPLNIRRSKDKWQGLSAQQEEKPPFFEPPTAGNYKKFDSKLNRIIFFLLARKK
jgi:hypothetical protein